MLGFDSHIITLQLFLQALQLEHLPVALYTGEGGAAVKRQAMAKLGPEAEHPPSIALCSDALSEGMNLRSASCVLHLDTPAVIRIAEQRAGRVGRRNSRHDSVEIWWPRDPPNFAPRRRELLLERHRVVSDLIGTNLELPRDVANSDEVASIEEVVQLADIDREEESRSGEIRTCAAHSGRYTS